MPEQKASIYDGEREVLRDVTVDLNEGETEVWGSFQLNQPRQEIKVGTSYVVKLDDAPARSLSLTSIRPRRRSTPGCRFGAAGRFVSQSNILSMLPRGGSRITSIRGP